MYIEVGYYTSSGHVADEYYDDLFYTMNGYYTSVGHEAEEYYLPEYEGEAWEDGALFTDGTGWV